MSKNIKPRYYFERVGEAKEGLSTKFRYVANHERKWGIGPAVKEIWKEATLGDIKKDAENTYEKEVAVLTTGAAGAGVGFIYLGEGEALRKMAQKMEESLDNNGPA